MINLKIMFYEEKEMQDIMIEFCLNKKEHSRASKYSHWKFLRKNDPAK